MKKTQKTQKIRLIEIEKDCISAVEEICPEIGLTVDESADTGLICRQGELLSVCSEGENIIITYRRKCELLRALSFLPAHLRDGKGIYETAQSKMLCYMADVSRNAVLKVDSVKRLIRYLSLCGYDSLMLYTEDTYELEGYPFFGYMRGRYTKEEMKEIDGYADRFGIEVIPCIQTLAHLQGALKWWSFRNVHDIDDILLVGEEKTYELIAAMLKTCRECFRSKRINIGMDEAHMLGRGKYMQKHGIRKQSDIMLEHLERVVALCEEYGYSPMMWSDMFFRMQFGGVYRVKEGHVLKEVRELVPSNLTLVYWDYVPTDPELFAHMLECHKEFDNPVAFAGGAVMWYDFAPHNRLSLERSEMSLGICKEKQLDAFIVTAWGDNGAEASLFSVLPTLLYYAEHSYGNEFDSSWMNKRSQECFGISFDDFLLLDTPNDMGEEYYKKNAPINPCKYLLYNDPLCGLMDRNMDASTVSERYRENAEKLRAYSDHPVWGYLFDTLYRLCDLLIEKSDISVRIRKAYAENDREALRRIADSELPTVIGKLEAFIDAYRAQWYSDNKTFGFDIQEDRLGGIRERLVSARKRLTAYLDGRVERIEELEQKQLLYAGIASQTNPYACVNNSYATLSASKMYL